LTAYSLLLTEDERNFVHKTALDFIRNPKNFSDVYLVAMQAWDNYSDYLLAKTHYYDDPNEPAIKSLAKKIEDTIYWRDRLFSQRKIIEFNREQIAALENAVKRTLSKAIA